MATRTGLYFSLNYNEYTLDPAPTGYVQLGSGAENSGLYRDENTMYIANELDGLEKVTAYPVQGNVITGSGTATVSTYDA